VNKIIYLVSGGGVTLGGVSRGRVSRSGVGGRGGSNGDQGGDNEDLY